MSADTRPRPIFVQMFLAINRGGGLHSTTRARLLTARPAKSIRAEAQLVTQNFRRC